MTSYETAHADAPPAARFDIGDAAFQIFKHAGREGPGGLFRLGAVVLALQLVLSALVMWGFWPLFEADLSADAPPDWRIFARLPLVYTLYFLGQVALYAATDAALLRWLYGRGGPRLSLGADTWRLIAVALCWLALSIAVFAPGPILLAVAGGAESALLGLLGGLLVLGGIGVWIWLALRLAPAAARSVYRGRVHFASAWRVSGAAPWPLTGAYVIVWAIYFGASAVVQAVATPLMMVVMFAPGSPLIPPQGEPTAEPDPEAVLQFLFSPGVLAVFAVMGAVSFAAYFLFQAMLAGANAYAVRYAESRG